MLRRPPVEGRVWIEDEMAAAIVDVANATYQTMLRLLAYAYVVPGPSAEKSLAVDLGIDLMKAMTLLAESAARRPAGPSNPDCNAGMSFTALRDAAPLPQGQAARLFFAERIGELADYASRLDQDDRRLARAAGLLKALAARAARFTDIENAAAAGCCANVSDASIESCAADNDRRWRRGRRRRNRATYLQRQALHSLALLRHRRADACFLANVQGPWIHPDDMDAEELMAVARECPSGAIQYRRKDGGREEQPPPVNLISVREAGPYALRGDLSIDGKPIRLPRHALPLRRIEEQTVLRRLAP